MHVETIPGQVCNNLLQHFAEKVWQSPHFQAVGRSPAHRWCMTCEGNLPHPASSDPSSQSTSPSHCQLAGIQFSSAHWNLPRLARHSCTSATSIQQSIMILRQTVSASPQQQQQNWWHGVVAASLDVTDEVTLYQARLVLGMVTVFSRYTISACKQQPPFYSNYKGQPVQPSQQLQLRTGGFCWCKVLLPACPCWQQPARVNS